MEEVNLKKKRFDRDFKVSAVKMITQEGHKASEVARKNTKKYQNVSK
jgi:transposase